MGDLFNIIIIMSVFTLVSCAWTYSWGYKEGKREGYVRGKSVKRHVSSKAVN